MFEMFLFIVTLNIHEISTTIRKFYINYYPISILLSLQKIRYGFLENNGLVIFMREIDFQPLRNEQIFSWLMLMPNTK